MIVLNMIIPNTLRKHLHGCLFFAYIVYPLHNNNFKNKNDCSRHDKAYIFFVNKSMDFLHIQCIQ